MPKSIRILSTTTMVLLVAAASADETQFKPAQFKVPEGYTVEVAAAPPLVKHPMMAGFDDRGRLFVAESSGMNLQTKDLEKQLPNFVRMLEDTDGDGRFDRSTIFADKMTLPMGALWHDGALYVASPPNIWRLEDTDDDGVADRRERIVSKFGYSGNAASVHGCFLGPDGRIYWCDGRHGHDIRDADGNLTSQGKGSYIFSCKPDGSDPRPHCGGGMDNPVEVDFTEEGEVLGTVNILYSRPREDCLVHWLYGGVYPHSQRVLGEFKRTGELLGPVHSFGHVTVSGLTRYRSGWLDPSFRDNMFVTIFNTGKLLRCELRREGATFRVTQREFLTAASPDVHPTDVLEDADGSLLLVDTGGWFRIGCPTSQIAKPQIQGAIYRIRRQGMKTSTDPRGLKIDWAKLENKQLADLLDDERFAVRERAIAECTRRGDEIVGTLGSMSSGSETARRNAVWALTRIGTPKAQAAVRQFLRDASSSMRLAACHSVATTRDAQAMERLIELLDEDEPAARRGAATALGRLGRDEVVPALLAALAGETDRSEEHALIYALIQTDDAPATAKGLTNSSSHVRRGALIALDQMDSGKLSAETVAAMLQSDDDPLRRAALDIFRRRPEWAQVAVQLSREWLNDPAAVASRGKVIRSLLTTFLSDSTMARLIGKILIDKSRPPATHELLLGAIRDGQAVTLNKTWIKPLERKLEASDPQMVEQALAAVAAIKTDRFDAKLKQLGADSKRPVLLRVAALEAVSGRDARLSKEAFDLLAGLLTQENTPRETARAAQMIGGASLTKQQLLHVAPLLRQAGPIELRALIRPFQRSQDVEVGRTFLASVGKAPGFDGLPMHELSDCIKRYPEELLSEANKLLGRLKQRDEQQVARLEQLLPKLASGDAKRGAALFAGEKTKCAVCHRVDTKGGQIGPDLSRIGRIRSGRDLLEAVLFPSSSLVREYEPYSVQTTRGKVLTGLIVQETPAVIHLQQQLGKPLAVPREEIERIVPSTVSIMPQGLDKLMSEQDLADLVAYLKSLK